MDDLKQNIRKWNHDILTHMIGITYLMDMQRYPEAERYCEKILNSLSAFSETFRTRATFPDPDSVSESPVSTDYLPDGFIEYQEKLPAEITAFQTLCIFNVYLNLPPDGETGLITVFRKGRASQVRGRM